MQVQELAEPASLDNSVMVSFDWPMAAQAVVQWKRGKDCRMLRSFIASLGTNSATVRPTSSNCSAMAVIVPNAVAAVTALG